MKHYYADGLSEEEASGWFSRVVGYLLAGLLMLVFVLSAAVSGTFGKRQGGKNAGTSR